MRGRPGARDRRLHRAARVANRVRRAAARATTTATALRYAGKVGTGFDTETLQAIGSRLRRLTVATPPFADPGSIKERFVTWVKPELVAQVGFTEWTGAGRLRHPRFLGLRDDKPASKVVRES